MAGSDRKGATAGTDELPPRLPWRNSGKLVPRAGHAVLANDEVSEGAFGTWGLPRYPKGDDTVVPAFQHTHRGY